MKNILILEDDKVLAKTLQASLESMQAKATWVSTLAAFYKRVESQRIELCVMDRMIGSEDSLEAVPYVREVVPHAKILFLSKKAAVLDRIHGLEAGADDYLAKPFSLAELRLRARRLLAWQGQHLGEDLALGKFVLRPEQGLLLFGNERFFLRKKEVEILQCLARAHGTCVSKKILSASLWPASREVNDNTIDVYIRRLRQKLGQHASILQTRRGFGYRWASVGRET